jgi:hypothetical protein
MSNDDELKVMEIKIENDNTTTKISIPLKKSPDSRYPKTALCYECASGMSWKIALAVAVERKDNPEFRKIKFCEICGRKLK